MCHGLDGWVDVVLDDAGGEEGDDVVQESSVLAVAEPRDFTDVERLEVVRAYLGEVGDVTRR